jgi:hypothetical protein
VSFSDVVPRFVLVSVDFADGPKEPRRGGATDHMLWGLRNESLSPEYRMFIFIFKNIGLGLSVWKEEAQWQSLSCGSYAA